MGNCGISSFFSYLKLDCYVKLRGFPGLDFVSSFVEKSAITIKDNSHYDEEGKKNSDKPFFVVNNGLFM